GISFRTPIDQLRKLARNLALAHRRCNEGRHLLGFEPAEGYALDKSLTGEVEQDTIEGMSTFYLDVTIHAHHENTVSPRVPGEMLQQLQTGAVGPVKVIQQESDRRFRGDGLKESSHSPEQTLLLVMATHARGWERDGVVGKKMGKVWPAP